VLPLCFAVATTVNIMQSSVQHRSRNNGLRIMAVAMWPILMATTGWTECLNRVDLQSYSFCAPMGWRENHTQPDIAVVCDSKTACATYFGAAPKGLAFLFIQPVKNEPGRGLIQGPRDVVSAAPHAAQPVPTISEVQLTRAEFAKDRKCFMSRRRLKWAGAWDEVYGLEVNGRLFSIWTRYEDNRHIQRYRDGILQIVSSIKPN